MTPDELGDNLARLVWESFSDFIADGDSEIALREFGVTLEDGAPDTHAVEEALIFLMWAHTRGVQLAFVGRAPDDLVRRGLDALHQAVFEDMAEHGTPESQLPLFEVRVGARYAEYHAAAETSDESLGEAVMVHLMDRSNGDGRHPGLARAVADRAIAVTGPLRDFLEEVELVD
ncbi:MAG: hypothetical protein KY453_07925 [Gemmatimonadetes bacterium]|nr:hypothetical protein [Gemmatimonadota bacterium]